MGNTRLNFYQEAHYENYTRFYDQFIFAAYSTKLGMGLKEKQMKFVKSLGIILLAILFSIGSLSYGQKKKPKNNGPYQWPFD